VNTSRAPIVDWSAMPTHSPPPTAVNVELASHAPAIVVEDGTAGEPPHPSNEARAAAIEHIVRSSPNLARMEAWILADRDRRAVWAE
jgi:hypothetical protein